MGNNHTMVTEFILVGFMVFHNVEVCMFVLISSVYVVTITTNIVIIIIVAGERHLHKPMYFFISGLSFLEIWYPSVTIPRLLGSLLTREETISRAGCLAQFYFHFSFGGTENFLLAAMAYDRYVAVCHPLRYIVIMRLRTCVSLLLGSWVFGFLVVINPCLQISNLLFCGCNMIDHYYCDFAPLLKLSCSDVSSIEKQVFVTACIVILGSLLVIIFSYACIIQTSVTFQVSDGRSKTFSTCVSHLMVVGMFYGTTIFMFIRPSTGDFLNVNKLISIFPSLVTPLINPIIYCLRNQEVKNAFTKSMSKMTCLQEERRKLIFC